MKFRGKIVQKCIRVVVFIEVLSESGLLELNTAQNHCHTMRRKKYQHLEKSRRLTGTLDFHGLLKPIKHMSRPSQMELQ